VGDERRGTTIEKGKEKMSHKKINNLGLINSAELKGKIIKFSNICRILSSYHLTREEIKKFLRILEKAGLVKAVKPGYFEILNDDLWLYLSGRRKSH